MIKRVISALVLVPIVVYAVVWADFFYVKLLVILIGALAYTEWMSLSYSLFNFTKLFYLSCFLFFSVFFLFYPEYSMDALFFCFVAHMVVNFASLEEGSFLNNQFYFSGLLYSSLYLFAVPFMRLYSGRLLLLVLFVSIWAGDSFAFFCGKAFGRRKLAPVISPKKTVEGAVCGVVFGVVLGGVFGHLLGLDVRDVLIVSFVSNISGILGDLAESVPKRFFGKKDSSNLIPGHGGVLDRLDSFAFAVFFSYLVLLWTNSLF